jgi:hypothetical protein
MNPIHVVQLWKGREVCLMSKQIEKGGKGWKHNTSGLFETKILIIIW